MTWNLQRSVRARRKVQQNKPFQARKGWGLFLRWVRFLSCLRPIAGANGGDSGNHQAGKGQEVALIGLIEDEQLLRKCVARRLELAGHSVCAVETAEEGYELISRLQPDVVITDLRLPGMSGQELLVRVKRNYPDVEIIIITAHGSEVDAEEARANGAAEYLSKPLDLIDLGRSVERCLLASTAFAGEGGARSGRFAAPERQPT